MSENQAPYGVSYIASAPEEFKVGDRVEIVKNTQSRYEGNVGTITLILDNGLYRVGFGGYSDDYPWQCLRKLPDTISFEDKDSEPWNVSMFRKLTQKMADTYARKNATYNDSFGKSVEKYGFIAALTRMSDKFNRIENLILGAENKVPDESLEDTLIDMACYAVMTAIALREKSVPDVDFENVD